MDKPLTAAELDTLRAEIATWKQGALNLLDIFNATCIALNGAPSPELGDWTPAMLPEKAAALRARNAALVAALEEIALGDHLSDWARHVAEAALASVKGEQG